MFHVLKCLFRVNYMSGVPMACLHHCWMRCPAAAQEPDTAEHEGSLSNVNSARHVASLGDHPSLKDAFPATARVRRSEECPGAV
jgi:hypothetical protein